MSAPVFNVFAIARHRINTDGAGVTTLVAAAGCPLSCRYCLNPDTLPPNAKYTAYAPDALYGALKPDDLYFQATGGGVTFGGGEPLAFAPFIRAFCTLCAGKWTVNIETSLNVPAENAFVPADKYIVDIKDMNPDIYRAYTGQDNARVIDNLLMLKARGLSSRVTVRVPLIPGFNTEKDREDSVFKLHQMGFTALDLFSYRVRTRSSEREPSRETQ